MPETTTIHINVQTLTGKSFPIDFDPTHTVGELKALIVAAGKGKSVKAPELEYDGHELRESRRVNHYGLTNNDVLHIVPPSKVPKTALEFVREDGSVFNITVSSDIKVVKLKEEIKIEEKISVRHLKLVNSQGYEDQMVTLLALQDDKAISEYWLEGKKVLVNDPVWEAAWAPSAIDILVSMDNLTEDSEGSRVGVTVRLDQTLASLKERILNYHSFHRIEHSLTLFGRELKDDEQTLGDLGLVEGCTVHAVAAIQFSVTTLTGKDYTFVSKATTRISEIRKHVNLADQNNYTFSLDGVHALQESCTLLDLVLYSISHRRELLGEMQTIGEEHLDGGDVVDSPSVPPNGRIHEEVEERAQIDGNLVSVDSAERSDFQLYVGEAEWTRDPGARQDNYDLFVEVKIDGGSEVFRTQRAKIAHWDQELTITGRPSSTIRFEIRSVAHNSSESLSVVRVETSVENLLEICADGDLAALELAIAPLVSATLDQATSTSGLKSSRHFAADSIGIVTVKLQRSPRIPPSLLQLRDIRTMSAPPMSQLERRIPEEFEERRQNDIDISAIADNISSIGQTYFMRFERLWELSDLENSILNFEQALAFTPDGHPDKPGRLSNLGSGYYRRFGRLGDLADLKNSIAVWQKAVASTLDGHPEQLVYLSNLSNGYVARFERFGDLADLEDSITARRQVVALTPDGHPKKPVRLSHLGNGYYKRLERLGDLADLENSIAVWQEAVALTPDGHPDKPECLTSLGSGSLLRFERLGGLTDLENSIAVWQEAVALTPDGHPNMPGRLSDLGYSYVVRFERLGGLTDLENSIASLEQAVKLTPDGHPDKPGRLSNLGISYVARFERLGGFNDLENSIASLEQAVKLTPDGRYDKPRSLSNLGRCYITRFKRLGGLNDLENSIASLEKAVKLAPDGHPEKPLRLSSLGQGYVARFERLGGLNNLEKLIASFEQAVKLTPDGHPDRSFLLLDLGIGQIIAWKHTQQDHHCFNALLSMSLAVQSAGASPRTVLKASRLWALLSLALGDTPSALEAFRTAIEILPQVAWLGLDIASRQEWLAKEQPEELGCMAATCAIWLGRFEEAVELLDMARSVFWQQASSVRSGLQDLKADWPKLAGELETVSQKLDTSSFSGLSTSNNDTQPYERRLADHRGLVLKRESLIEEIRSLPGFEFFLKPTPFNRLFDAAVAGRVVIINISIYGADALVFSRTDPICHVPLSKVGVAKSVRHTLNQTRDDPIRLDQDRSLQLTLPDVLNNIEIDARKLDSETDITGFHGAEQEQARADVTEDRQSSQMLPRVWERMLKPIFTEVGIPLEVIKDQVPTNRIFWYLTGPLTFIPIHATEHVSQLVVSSYVTTLSSLAEAQKRQGVPIRGPPRLLAITQPDTPGKLAIPCATDEVNNVMDALSANGWPLGNLQRFDRTHATIDNVSAALDSCSWAHFACHAIQHPIDGMESAFALHDGSLKLSAIAAKRLSSARFAFLSTCESASGLQHSPGEAMHLSAGMQFAGFSSVIATMWSIRDEDAPIVAKHTYTYLLRNGVDNIDLTEGAAALSHAVAQLRKDPTVTMKRWAPFVYYGV